MILKAEKAQKTLKTGKTKKTTTTRARPSTYAHLYTSSSRRRFFWKIIRLYDHFLSIAQQKFQHRVVSLF
jgi:hypothetical protein